MPDSGVKDDRSRIAASFHERLDALGALLGNVGDTSTQPTARGQLTQTNGCLAVHE
jgi:hypothetical protein